MSKVFLTGASGWLGREITNRLVDQGIKICILGRTPPLTRSGVRWFELDLESSERIPEDWSMALDPEDIFIHCAASAHRPKETAADRHLFTRVNVEGTRKVVRMCQERGIKRFVSVSSIAVYDWLEKARMSEDSSLKPTSAYGRSKLAAEEIVQTSGLDWRIVRLGTVYGAGDRANFSRMANAMKRRRFPIPGRGDARKSVISVTEAAALLSAFALQENPQHRLINMANPHAPCLQEIADAFSAQCGFPSAPRIPLPMIQAAAKVGDLLCKLKPGFPLNSSNIEKLTTSTWVDVTRMRENFPDHEWKPFRETLKREHADWYRKL